MITSEQYTEIKERYDSRHALVLEYCKAHKTNGIPYEVQKGWPQISHEETSALEVYEFINNPTERYFAHIRYEGEEPRNRTACTVTTWTGEELGKGYFTSRLYENNLGDKRITFTVKGIDGRMYHGTFYYSAGDYCRMRLAKRQ